MLFKTPSRRVMRPASALRGLRRDRKPRNNLQVVPLIDSVHTDHMTRL
ncbi:unnamed protein product [Protopolystoma xenopodis]|uniref:Uncharacterized protein n=1 Tax=Protopolystoma xenopodis TaxID=117903 RepID=A0A3S5CR56_9PLAT|nr:unnamed protein product [Protopolystoma xenopodis]